MYQTCHIYQCGNGLSLMRIRIIVLRPFSYNTFQGDLVVLFGTHKIFNSLPNLIHRKGEFSAAAIGKSRKKERLATGEDIQHPFEKFNKIDFQERKEAAV